MARVVLLAVVREEEDAGKVLGLSLFLQISSSSNNPLDRVLLVAHRKRRNTTAALTNLEHPVVTTTKMAVPVIVITLDAKEERSRPRVERERNERSPCLHDGMM